MKPIDPNNIKTLHVGLDTHQGETGKNNEDSCDFFAFQVSEQNQTQVLLGIVADGIGGHQAGERASSLALDIVKKHFIQASTPRLLSHLKEAFLSANAQVVKEGQENRKLRGMGSTMTAAAIMDKKLYIANVGDSRAYLLRNGILRQLTIDHTWAQEAIDAGRLTPAEAKSHPNRNVIKRYMGIQSEMEVDFRLHNPDGVEASPSESNQGFQLQDGDVILLNSDGLSDMVTDEDIQAILNKYEPQKAAQELVLLARKKGGYDNISVVVMQVPGKKKVAGKSSPMRFLPILGGLFVLAILGAGLVWAFAAGPLKKSTPEPTLQATAESPATTIPAEATEPLTQQAATKPPAATETPPPSRTATPTEAPAGETDTGLSTPTRLPTFTPTNTPLPTRTSPPPTIRPTDIPAPVATDTPSSSGGGKDKGGKKPEPTR